MVSQWGRGLVPLLAVPSKVHGSNWDALRAFAYSATQVVACNAPYDRIEEGHFGSHQLYRMLGFCHRDPYVVYAAMRIREGMRFRRSVTNGRRGLLRLTRRSLAAKPDVEARPGWVKHAVLTLVERGGSARSFHVDECNEGGNPADHPRTIYASHVMTDEARALRTNSATSSQSMTPLTTRAVSTAIRIARPVQRSTRTRLKVITQSSSAE